MKRRLYALPAGIAGAALPLIAAAQTAGERTVERPADAGGVVLLTLIAVAVVFFIAGIGYLYRRERNLEWSFQRPDEEDEHH